MLDTCPNHQLPPKFHVEIGRLSYPSLSLYLLYLKFQGRMQEGTAKGSDAPSESGEDASGQQRRIRWVGDGRDTHPHHLSLRAVSLADGGRCRCTCSRGSHRRASSPSLAGSDSRYRRSECGRYLPVRGRCSRADSRRGRYHRGSGLRCEARDRGSGRGRGRGVLPATSGRGRVPRRRAHLLHERSARCPGPRHGHRLPPNTHDRPVTNDTHTPFATAVIAAHPEGCRTYIRLLFRLI